MKKAIVVYRIGFNSVSELRCAPGRARTGRKNQFASSCRSGPAVAPTSLAAFWRNSMQAKLGKPVIVENKPGAGGIIGNEVVANADPDGYTLGIMTAGQIIAAVTRKNMRYDTLTAFAPSRPDRYGQLY